MALTVSFLRGSRWRPLTCPNTPPAAREGRQAGEATERAPPGVLLKHSSAPQGNSACLVLRQVGTVRSWVFHGGRGAAFQARLLGTTVPRGLPTTGQQSTGLPWEGRGAGRGHGGGGGAEGPAAALCKASTCETQQRAGPPGCPHLPQDPPGRGARTCTMVNNRLAPFAGGLIRARSLRPRICPARFFSGRAPRFRGKRRHRSVRALLDGSEPCDRAGPRGRPGSASPADAPRRSPEQVLVRAAAPRGQGRPATSAASPAASQTPGKKHFPSARFAS